MGFSTGLRIGLLLVGLLLLAACNHDEKDPPPPAATYSVGGTVSGLTGSVTLANNGGDARTVSANGAFTFATPLASGANYAVAVTSQPANQTCTVGGGSGAVAAANVSSVAVTCATNTFTVGGTVSGLDGSVTLMNNAGDAYTTLVNGAFTFASSINSGTNYSVTVGTQPVDQTCTVASATGTASANVTTVAVTCATYRVHATIGTGGGTVTHPDGAQVVIPPGALAQDTVIGIATPANGWPTPFLEDVTQLGPVYEFTPHDVTFAKPVRIRLPKATGSTNTPGAMVATMGEGWQFTPALPIGNFVEYERLTFSWHTQAWYVCAGSPPLDCGSTADVRYGFAYPAATPGNAIVMTSGGNALTGNSTSVANSAGTWDLDLDSLQSLQITLEYFASADCGGSHATLKGFQASPSPRLVVLQDFGGLPNGHGVVTANIPTGTLVDGRNVFFFSMKCARPGKNESGGGDWITFNAQHGITGGFTVGGTVTGLTGAGLELQNSFREILPVPAASSTFSFRGPIASGQPYEVRVRTQPTGNHCTVANAKGTISTDVNDVIVTCVPTQSSTIGYAMVANSSSNNFSLYSRSSGGGLNALATTAVGATPSAVAIAPNGVFAYTADKFSDRISAFNVVDPGAGSYQATLVGTASVSGPTAIVVEPGAGRFLWTLSEVSPGKITAFQVSATNGALSQPVQTSTNAFCSGLGVHPSGQFVYVACGLSQTLFSYSVNGSTGALTQFDSLGQTVSSGGHMVFSPDGKFLFLLNGTSVIRFSVNTSTGQLRKLGTTFVDSASNASDIAIRPAGDFLYVGADSSLGGFIRSYVVDANGGLTAATDVALPSRTPSSLAIDATGSSLYAALYTPGTVVTYQVNGSTGALTQIDSDATGSQPLGIAVTP